MTKKLRAQKVHYKAVSGTSCRAVYTHHAGMIHNIEFTFKTESGDEVIIEMPFDVARETLNAGIASYQAIMTPLQISRQVPFGG